MKKRRSGRILLAALVALGLVVGGSAVTGRLPCLTHAWGTIASSVAALPSSVASSETEGPPRADAGVVVRKQTAPLSSAQLGAPLVHGAFVSACGAPDDMKVVVKVAVRMGHAVDVGVKTDPPNPAVASCVEKATREMQWDISPKTEHVTVSY
jgi:hypothetical protein